MDKIDTLFERAKRAVIAANASIQGMERKKHSTELLTSGEFYMHVQMINNSAQALQKLLVAVTRFSLKYGNDDTAMEYRKLYRETYDSFVKSLHTRKEIH